MLPYETYFHVSNTLILHRFYIDFHSTFGSPGTETTICGGFGFNILTVFSLFRLLHWLLHKYTVLNQNVLLLLFWSITIYEEYLWLFLAEVVIFVFGKGATSLTIGCLFSNHLCIWRRCNVLNQAIVCTATYPTNCNHREKLFWCNNISSI